MKIIWNTKSHNKNIASFHTNTQPTNLPVIDQHYHCTNHSNHPNHYPGQKDIHLKQHSDYDTDHLKQHLNHNLKLFETFKLQRAKIFKSLLAVQYLIFIFCCNLSTIHTHELSFESNGTSFYSTIYFEYQKCKEKELEISRNETYRNLYTGYCLPFFDGYLCWDDAKHNQTSYKQCPDFFENSDESASSDCLSLGNWSSTTNYDSCGNNRYQNIKVEYEYLKHIHNTVWKNVNFSYPIYYDELSKCIDTSLREDFKTLVKNESYCNSTFDGYRCWPRTMAGETIHSECPKHSKASENDTASKKCLEDGTWFKHPKTNMIWSNYSRCHDFKDLEYRNLIIKFFSIGYTVSLIAMLISISIFFSFRSLKCTRISVHKNLFFSFIIGNIHWIYVNNGIFNQVDVLQNNSIFCRIVYSSTKYFTHTNYMWTFAEGLHLHTCVVYGFVNEKYLIYYLMLIGWLSPLCYYLPYVVMRSLSNNKEDTNRCWIDDSPTYENWLQYPIFIVILLNIFFLINIIRVLRSKLKRDREANNHHIKTVKAFFFLFPLLSLQYVITLSRPSDGSDYEKLYDSILCFAASLQGLFVSVFFCFFNNEVQTLIKKKYRLKFGTDKHNKNKRLSTNFRTTTEEITLFE